MNKQINEKINELYNKIDYLNDIIDLQTLEKSQLQQRYNALFEAHKIQEELLEDKESKIDKAIEYIKSCEWSNGIDNEIQYSLHIPTLLKILGDKE